MSLDARWSALVKSGRAGWRAGMAAAVGPRLIGRVIETTADGLPQAWVTLGEAAAPRLVLAYGTPGWASDVWSVAPDWTDPATLGCMLSLVRERWGEPYAHARFWEGCREWTLEAQTNPNHLARVFRGRTEAEALIAALEAAPEERP